MFKASQNDQLRQQWLARVLSNLSSGLRILDAGAGELRNKEYCSHLDYVSQDFGEYKGLVENAPEDGLQNLKWNAAEVDIISDINNMPVEDSSFDVVLCSEVLEHIPDPVGALAEFNRILKPGGQVILTAPFTSWVHMAPYHYCSGFSRYWYEYHLPSLGFNIIELEANGDWFAFLEQEISRTGYMERRSKNWCWPLAYAFSLMFLFYLKIRPKKQQNDVACFGFFCIAENKKIGKKSK